MKIGEIFEAMKTEKIADIAKRIEGISEKPLRTALKKAGYEYSNAEPKGWHFAGTGEEPTDKSIFDYHTKATANYRRNERTKENTGELKNIRTNERNHDTIKEQTEKTTKEEGNKMRKRASFDIENELLKELKIYAIREEKNVYEVVENAIRTYLNERK